MSRIGWCLAIASILIAEPALAWRAQGHMATGLIAYDRLAARDPAAIAAIEALMAQHPDHARFESGLAGLEGAERERRMFALMARWPDDIRATRWNHTHWHHQLRVVVGWKAFRGPRVGEADFAFRHNLKILRNPQAEPAKRAVALCWIFHVVGDMHQPLHAGHRQDKHFPLTDFAGSKGWVRRSADAAPETFHHFWDTPADRPGDELAGAAAIAAAIESDPPAVDPPGSDPVADYRAWVAESERIAAEKAYPDAMDAEGTSREKAGTLTPDYVERARVIGERRIGEAGERLADLLAALFPAGPGLSRR